MEEIKVDDYKKQKGPLQEEKKLKLEEENVEMAL